MRTRHGVRTHLREGVSASSGLAVFAAVATCEETEPDPIKHGDEVGKVLGLGIERVQHLMHVGFLFGLCGAPFECLSNGISKWGKNPLHLWANHWDDDPNFSVQP